jgi:hypothetical protein
MILCFFSIVYSSCIYCFHFLDERKDEKVTEIIIQNLLKLLLFIFHLSILRMDTTGYEHN